MVTFDISSGVGIVLDEDSFAIASIMDVVLLTADSVGAVDKGVVYAIAFFI